MIITQIQTTRGKKNKKIKIATTTAITTTTTRKRVKNHSDEKIVF